MRSKRSVGLVTGLSMLLGMLALVPVPAVAADLAPDYLASFEACPEEIIPSAGFGDVPSQHPNADDIDCIAYYGITKGTSPTTYSPDLPVIREHMALFLVRLARLVGIDLPPPADTPFDDIGDLNPGSRDAISQMYQLEITTGASANTYEPARNVTRGEMALVLQRLMDEMVPVADGRIAFGHIPDDVDDNDGKYDVRSPFEDLERVPHQLHEAITHLYELGVAGGLSGLVYGHDQDMSRAAMAEFMAAILDHSNLRPKGLLVQVTPAQGKEDFDVVVMASVRDDNFAPIEDVVVDWFYTDDPGGGLADDGTCDQAKIRGDGDCVWDRGKDEMTDLDGNVYADFDATPGATMTIYAWIGRRNRAAFDKDTANFSRAQAKSEKAADSLLVTHDIPAGAARIDGDGAFIVDLDRRSSVEFTIRLVDGDGSMLKKEGTPIDIEIESREVRVEAADVTRGRPDPDLVGAGRDVSVETTVPTDGEGRATFVLKRPTRDERLDTVTIEADCCAAVVYQIAWSDANSVLVAAHPNFELYQRRDGDRIGFTVGYDLFDQYGGTLRGTDSRYTGRPDTDLAAQVSYRLYGAQLTQGDSIYTVEETPDAAGTSSVKISRRSVTADVEIDIPSGLREGREFLVRVDAQVFSDADGDGDLDSNEVRYVDSREIVWIVRNARNENELDLLRGRDLNAPSGLNLKEVELYSEGQYFRTFFTLWSYGPDSAFQVDGELVDVETFETEWEEQVDGIDDLDILIYGTGFIFVVIE